MTTDLSHRQYKYLTPFHEYLRKHNLNQSHLLTQKYQIYRLIIFHLVIEYFTDKFIIIKCGKICSFII